MSHRIAIGCAAALLSLLSVSQSFAADSAKDQELVCHYELRPGSHMKMRICATAEQWADSRERARIMGVVVVPGAPSAASQGTPSGPGTVTPPSVIMTR